MTNKDNSRIDPVKKAFTLDSFSVEQIQELQKCAMDFMYFATKYVYVQHPVKGRVIFEPFPYQIEMLTSLMKYKQLIFLCGRQLGKCSFNQTRINISNTQTEIGTLLWKDLTLKEKLITKLENLLIKLKLQVI